jgi:hypothetical protein
MSEQSNNPRDPEDPMARISGAVSEDYQAVTTDQDPQMTAEAAPPVPEGDDPGDNLQPEVRA